MARIKITELPVELNQKQMADSRGGAGRPDFVDQILLQHLPANVTNPLEGPGASGPGADIGG